MKRNQFILLSVIVALLLGAVVWAVALRSPKQAEQKVAVTATFYPLAEFTRKIGGDKVTVQTLVRPGVEPHDYEPNPKDLTELYRSKLLVYNGAGFEPWLHKLQKDLQGQRIQLLDTSKGVTLLPANHDDEASEAHEEEAEEAYDPHIWLDPVAAQAQVRAIGKALAEIDPASKSHYQTRTETLVAQLAELDHEFSQGLKQCAHRNIVTSHQAFSYVAARYNLQVVSLTGLSPEEEPSPQKLAEVATFAKVHQVRYIFFETLVSPKLSETIAQEVGAKTLVFNPLEGLSEEEVGVGKDYFSVQKDNLQNLRLALDCK